MATDLDESLKRAIKDAVAEALLGQRELFREVFAEVIEDFALAEAIRKGQGTAIMSREEVFQLLPEKP